MYRQVPGAGLGASTHGVEAHGVEAHGVELREYANRATDFPGKR
ncbi:hypothetical protein [Streptomyces varsoviensis]|nr:hypothetical protein [Streptomyces varsoviensis]